jgi:large subunit ribosomal protein L33
MARGKGKTVAIKMNSTAGTGFFYTTCKNVTKNAEKLTLVKFDPIVRQRVLFKEGKSTVQVKSNNCVSNNHYVPCSRSV